MDFLNFVVCVLCLCPPLQVVHVACGDSQTMALTVSGAVFGWGCYKDKEGQKWFDRRPGDKASLAAPRCPARERTPPLLWASSTQLYSLLLFLNSFSPPCLGPAGYGHQPTAGRALAAPSAGRSR